MKFLYDVTIREGESVTPNKIFIKKWKVKNCGIYLFGFKKKKKKN